MPWSSVHRGDYQRLRKHLTIALLEVEALEPRVQLAYARGELSDALTANIGLLRLMLERADWLSRQALDHQMADHWEAYSESTYRDRRLAEADGVDVTAA